MIPLLQNIYYFVIIPLACFGIFWVFKNKPLSSSSSSQQQPVTTEDYNNTTSNNNNNNFVSSQQSSSSSSSLITPILIEDKEEENNTNQLIKPKLTIEEIMFNIKKRKESVTGVPPNVSPSSTPLSGTMQSPLIAPMSPNFVSRQCPFKKFGCSSFLVSKAEFDNHLKDDAQFHLQLTVEKFDHQFDLHTQLMAHFTEQMEDQLEKTMKVVRNHTDSLGSSVQTKLDEGVEKCMTFAKKVEQQQQQLAKRLITQQITQDKKISSPLVKGSGDDSFDGANIGNSNSYSSSNLLGAIGGSQQFKQQLDQELSSLSTKMKKELADLSDELSQKLERTTGSMDSKINRIEGEVQQKIDKRSLTSVVDDSIGKKTDSITYSIEGSIIKKIEEKEKKKSEQAQLLYDSKIESLKDKIKIIETQQLDQSSEVRKLKLDVQQGVSASTNAASKASSSSMYISSSVAQSNNINKNEIMEEVKKVEEKFNKRIREEMDNQKSEISSVLRVVKENKIEVESLEKDCKTQFDKQDNKIKQVEDDLKKSDSLLMLMQNNLKKYNEFVDRERDRESERIKLQESIKRLELNQKKIEAEIQEGNEQVERALREESLSPIVGSSVPKSPIPKRASLLLNTPPMNSSQPSSPKMIDALSNSSSSYSAINSSSNNLGGVGGSDGETGILWEFDPIINKWIRLVIKLKVERKPFAEGALREAYHTMSLGVTSDEAYPLGSTKQYPPIELITPSAKSNEASSQLKSGTKFVLKLYKKEAESQVSRELYFEDVKMQMVCRDLGHKFNQKKPPKKIEFLMAWVVELIDRSPSSNGSSVLCSIEPLLVGEFKKNNSNYGAVLTNRSTPQSFSHFTYELSNKQLIVVDIQGVDDLYTDPQVHTPDGKGYGLGNLGKAGINKFITTHKCNAVCALLDLDVKLGGVLSGNNKKQLQQGTMVMPDIVCDLAPSDNTIRVGAKILPKAEFSKKDLKCITTIQSFRERVNSIAFFDNEKLLCAGYGDGTYRIFDILDAWKCIHTVSGHRKSIESIACNSNYIFTCGPDHTIKVHILRSNNTKCIETLIGHSGEINCVVANEKYLFSCGYDKTVKVWDLVNFVCVKSFEGVHTKYIKTLALSGRYLFSGGNDQVIYVWDTETLSMLFNMQGHEDWILSLHCTASYLFSTSKDNVIKIWDLSNFSCIDTLKGHWNSVSSSVVKDRYLYSGAEDNSIKVWDLDTLECVYTVPKAHSLGVKSLLAFKDNHQLISAAFDGSIKLWEWVGKA